VLAPSLWRPTPSFLQHPSRRLRVGWANTRLGYRWPNSSAGECGDRAPALFCTCPSHRSSATPVHRITPRFDAYDRRLRVLTAAVIARGVEQADLQAAATGSPATPRDERRRGKGGGGTDARRAGNTAERKRGGHRDSAVGARRGKLRRRVYQSQWYLPGTLVPSCTCECGCVCGCVTD